MAVKTFWHFDTSVSGFGRLDEGSAPGAANTATIVNWSALLSSGFGFTTEPLIYGSTVTANDGVQNFPGAPSGGNGLRSLNTLSGTFAAGTWSFFLGWVGSGNDAFASLSAYFRIYKSVNANGSGATEITSGRVQTSNPTDYNTTPSTTDGSTGSLGAVTLTNEFLFVTWAFDSAPNAVFDTSGTNTIRVGTTKLVTTNFTSAFTVYNETLSESASAADAYSSVQVFACPLAELACGRWNFPAGILWGATTGDWGRNLQLFTPNIVFTPIPLSESANPTDTLVGNITSSNALSEVVAAADAYVPNLVISKTLAEAVTPGDALSAQIIFSLALSERLVDYWGTPGILWGASTGVWGNGALDSLSAIQTFSCPLSETASATESLVGLAVFSSTLAEAASPVDVYVPGLVMPVTLSEVAAASDAFIAANVMPVALLEPLANYWGSPGILWGATTGVWGGDVQDSLSAQSVFNTTLAEIVNASDTLISVQVFVSSLSESVTATDQYVPNLVISGTLTEAGGATDLYSAQQVFRNFLSEFVHAAESLSFTLTGSASNAVIVEPAFAIFGVSPIEDPLGVDVSSFPDMDPLGVLVFGIEALAQRVARRLTNGRGVWFWAPNEGLDTRQYLNDTITQERISTIQNEIEREVLREEAVKTVTSTIIYDAETGELDVRLAGLTSEGPFNFVFEVTSSKLTIVK